MNTPKQQEELADAMGKEICQEEAALAQERKAAVIDPPTDSGTRWAVTFWHNHWLQAHYRTWTSIELVQNLQGLIDDPTLCVEIKKLMPLSPLSPLTQTL